MDKKIILLNLLNQGQMTNPNTTIIEPLGCLYLISNARHQGFNIDFCDFQTVFTKKNKKLTLHELWEKVCNSTTEILGVSCMSTNLPLALVLAKYHKQIKPNSKIILGGSGPSTCAQKILDYFSFIDYVVKGEGEKSFLKILHHLNTVSNKNSKIERLITDTPCDINEIPFPDRRIIPDQEYETSILSARGCPYSCAFCSSKVVWGKLVRRRTPENIIKELIQIRNLITEGSIKRRQPERVNFIDDTFIHNKRQLCTFARLLKEHDLKINFRCYARIEQLDKETLLILKELGCKSLHVGIESGSDKVLKAISNKASKQKVMDTCQDVIEIIGSLAASFIYGFPFESLNDLRETLGLVRQLDMIGVETLLFPLMPLLGSNLYDNFSKGYKLSESIISDQLASEHLETEVVDMMCSYIHNHPDLFVNFCVHKDSNLEEKEKLICDHIAL